MRLKIKILILFYLLLAFKTSAQNIDSLITLSKYKSGHEKGILYKQIGELYQNSNPDSAVYYYLQALQYNNSDEEIAELHGNMGNIYFYKNNFSEALNNFKFSLRLSLEIENDSILARRYSDIGVVYDYLGAYDKSAEHYYKALNLFEENNDKAAASKTYNNLGIIHQARGQYDLALEFYSKSLKIRKETNADEVLIATLYVNFGSTYEDFDEYDKALHFYKKALKVFKETGNTNYTVLALNNIAGVMLKSNKQDSAMLYANEAFALNKSQRNRFNLINYYTIKGEIFNEQNLPDSSIKSFNKSLELAENPGFIEKKVDIFTGLIKVYKKNGNFKKALSMQEELLTIQDSLNNEKTMSKIETLRIVHDTEAKEKEIILLQKKIFRNKIFIAVTSFILLLISFIIVLFLKQKLVRAKYRVGLFNQRLLRLQMSPHFIFNALASIQSYMLEKNVKQAALYLSSFSKLTRAILNNSREEFITLQNDIETIEDYLKIQQMRFDDRFTYEIITDIEIDPDNIQIPPMLIQPFVENAVVHGFKDISYTGHIVIEYKKINNTIEITVEDNGKGLKKTSDNSLHKSHALDITEERLKILNKKKKHEIMFEFVDMADDSDESGVRVIFNVPLVKRIVENKNS